MTDLEHYIEGEKVTAKQAETALAKAEKDGKPVHYDTVDTSPPDHKGRAMNAVMVLGYMDGPTDIAAITDWLNAAVDVYGLDKATKTDVKKLLAELVEDGLVDRAGDEYKAVA